MKKPTEREKDALAYAIEFLYNSYKEHSGSSIARQIKPELNALIRLKKKLKNETT